jgi:hypothetical protein
MLELLSSNLWSYSAAAADKLIKELTARFPASNIMDSMGAVYP